MEVHRRNTKPNHHPTTTTAATTTTTTTDEENNQPKASDALPLPLYITNTLFFTLFFFKAYFLLLRWGDKIRNSIPLHVLTFSELAAIVTLSASLIYLFGFFGINFVQPSTTHDQHIHSISPSAHDHDRNDNNNNDNDNDDHESLVQSVVDGSMPSYALETQLKDCLKQWRSYIEICLKAAFVRREVVQRITGKSLEGLPLYRFDYDSILNKCCEMPVGYVQIPVGVAGPLLLDGNYKYTIPMATTEGCLVASTNRGCKAIFASGGATSYILKDGMSRAPIVRFPSAKQASHLKFFLEDPPNFDTIYDIFNQSSRFARLQSIKCTMVGKNLYIRFSSIQGMQWA